ncbi:class II fructose-bisphosphate aldolase [Pectinatus haikarae]|uniref:Fructose-bisphosphate aldolase class II n=1 Tax=Pectinatus haikarae TaxID=349096 RepID=A0ABT9Y864_9FIRM|nr:class II fructose-bisphosphate aldolase [Pectinatus haikarae]MDQ0204020.1 fructose-bisphosphate aldolase class II [Pectinatus haikarae]
MLVNMNEMLQRAKKEKYAVAAFDCVEDIFVRTILDTAERMHSPVILMALEYDLAGRGMDYISGLIKAVAPVYDISVALHLDHATNFAIIERALANGFTSVMYDGSALPFEENIANTRHVVQMAQKYNATVEAELGHVAGKELSGCDDSHEIELTEPKEVKTFIEETGIDALAVSIGTAHGIYISEPKLNIERLQEITAASKVPLVLHGGSGTPETELRAAVSNGITKINVYSDLRIALGEGLKSAAVNKRRDPLPDKAFSSIKEAIGQVVGDRIELFGSKNKEVD